MTEHQIGKLGKTRRRNTLRSSHMKFYHIRSRGCGTDRQTHRRTDGQSNRTDLPGLICSCSNVIFLTSQMT